MNRIDYKTQAKLKSYLYSIFAEKKKEINDLKTLKNEMKSVINTERTLVFGDGSTNCEIMFIGEAPGEEENRLGVPFVGKSGKLLRNIIKYMNVSYYITNMVPYRPPNNRDPTPSEIEIWKKYLICHIKIVNPKNIVLVGRIAAQNMLNTTQSISFLRLKKYLLFEKPTFVFYHPSYLIRCPSQKSLAYKDIKFILSNI